MIELRAGSINFSKMRGNGPGRKEKFFNFTRPVRQAVAILAGTSFGFSEYDDHHLGRVDVKVDATVSGNTVTVTATFGVRDWSGSWDDKYEGTIFISNSRSSNTSSSR